MIKGLVWNVIPRWIRSLLLVEHVIVVTACIAELTARMLAAFQRFFLELLDDLFIKSTLMIRKIPFLTQCNTHTHTPEAEI